MLDPYEEKDKSGSGTRRGHDVSCPYEEQPKNGRSEDRPLHVDVGVANG